MICCSCFFGSNIGFFSRVRSRGALLFVNMRSGIANNVDDDVFDRGMGKQVLAYCLKTGFMEHVAEAARVLKNIAIGRPIAAPELEPGFASSLVHQGLFNSVVDDEFDQGIRQQALAYCLRFGFCNKRYDTCNAVIEIPTCILQCPYEGPVWDHERRPTRRGVRKRLLQQDQIYTDLETFMYARMLDCLLSRSSELGTWTEMTFYLSDKTKKDIIVYALDKLRAGSSVQELEQLRSFEDLAMFFFTRNETLLRRAFHVRMRRPTGGPIEFSESEPGVASFNEDAAFFGDWVLVGDD